MARSLSDCDCCNCSNADAGVGTADFLLGPILLAISCVSEYEGIQVFVLATVAAAGRFPRGSYRMQTSVVRWNDRTSFSKHLRSFDL